MVPLLRPRPAEAVSPPSRCLTPVPLSHPRSLRARERAETVSAGRRRGKGRLQRAGTLGAALRRCSRGSRVAQERPAPLWTSHLGACRRPVPARDHPRSGTTGGQVISALPTRGPRSATVSVPAQIRSSHHCSR